MLKSQLGLLEECNRGLDVFVLTRGEDGEEGILDRVQLVRQSLDQGVVQDEQVRVAVEGLLLEVSDQLLANLMPKSKQIKVRVALSLGTYFSLN